MNYAYISTLGLRTWDERADETDSVELLVGKNGIDRAAVIYLTSRKTRFEPHGALLNIQPRLRDEARQPR